MGKLKHRVKVGSIVLSEWENGEEEVYTSIRICRVYSKNGKWGFSSDLRKDDLLRVKEAIDKYRREEYDTF